MCAQVCVCVCVCAHIEELPAKGIVANFRHVAVDWTSVHVYTIEWYWVVTIYIMQLWVSVHINIVNRRH